METGSGRLSNQVDRKDSGVDAKLAFEQDIPELVIGIFRVKCLPEHKKRAHQLRERQHLHRRWIDLVHPAGVRKGALG